MKKGLLNFPVIGLLFLLTAGSAFSQNYRVVPLDSVNLIPMDSLRVADSLLTNGGSLRASLTDGFFLHDTITVTGVLTTDTRVLRNVLAHFSFYIQNPDSAAWGGMNIYTTDTSAAILNAGFGSIDSGYLIQVTGVLTKYGTDIWGNFELVPIGSASVTPIPINVLDAGGNRPAPVEVKVSDLVTGDRSSGGISHFYPGTKYKNSYVILRNLIVKSRAQTSGTGQWTVTLEDSLGNTISLYDPSQYFTGRSYGVTPKWIAPAPGSKIDYIKGILASYSSYGYEIVPLYPGDVKIGTYTPSISATGFSTRRSPSIPTSGDAVTIRAVAFNPDPNAASMAVDSTDMYYSVNNGAYTRVKMTADTSNTFVGTIPAQADGALVTYFFSAWQDSTLALKSSYPDTSRTAMFYYVRSNGYTIRDLQYTPFKDGNSGEVDLTVTVNGIIQADTSDYPAEADPRSQATKTPYAYIQDAAAPWSGIMLFDTTADKLVRGDSVSITGTISEYNGMTEMAVNSFNVIQSGKQTSPAVRIHTGDIGTRFNGDTLAERWEGVLVKFDSIHIVDNDPDGPTYSITGSTGSFREYMVDDGSGKCRVDDDGSNTYSVDPHDTTLGFHIMPLGAYMSSLTGIIKYVNSEYKLEPRTNSDFVGEIDAVKREGSSVPASYSLLQNYPNPFNPTTTIRYSLPQSGMVSLKIYNILGQEVTTLVNQHQSAGNYTATFDASRFASGVYFYRLNAGSFNQVRKMLLLK
ncbi:MAG TPA: T9SS type A sorting domain-containing protein [Candidatus Kryptonia bacterium]